MPTQTMSAKQLLDQYRPMVEAALAESLPSGSETPSRLREAMQYSLMAGGKRLRPILVLLATEACGEHPSAALPAACAIEMVHTYSLIHDDLPAMDDDELRRGQPTSHVVFGDAMAILAGDALLTRAFEILASEVSEKTAAAECCRVLAAAAGSEGMVGGQVADLQASDAAPDDLEEPIRLLDAIHLRKTGRLLACSLELGAIVAGADDDIRRQLGHFGQQIGLAFQVADDLLDVVGDASRTGKAGGRDAELGKWTYPALVGVEESRDMAARYIAGACEALAPLGDTATPLVTLAGFIIERDH
ncbi:MAG: farnesyl-diphosphate synthase [Planctomycetaceae bacterium]|nr:farnesyl-diphosphate synthase [Planctomycetaceae bacterium]